MYTNLWRKYSNLDTFKQKIIKNVPKNVYEIRYTAFTYPQKQFGTPLEVEELAWPMRLLALPRRMVHCRLIKLQGSHSLYKLDFSLLHLRHYSTSIPSWQTKAPKREKNKLHVYYSLEISFFFFC